MISVENIFLCWDEYRKGKSDKPDVAEFEFNLEDNIFQLQQELQNQTYGHSKYEQFQIYDPKHRIIHKAAVRDRLVHHLVFKELYKIFDPTFIYHSYSSREGKGTHLAVKNLSDCLRKISKNYVKPAYALKCDVRKFFHSISHKKLFEIIKNRIGDTRFLWLVDEIISSFSVFADGTFERERES